MEKKSKNSDKIDRHLLHQFLWKYRDRNGFNSYKPGELAEMLGTTVYNMSRILNEMTRAGMLKKHSAGKYHISDPTLGSWAQTEYYYKESNAKRYRKDT